MRKRKRVTTPMTKEFKQLYEGGESSHSIAKKFNVDHKTVLRHLHISNTQIRCKSESAKLGLMKGRVKPPTEPHVLPFSSKELTPEKAYVLGVVAGDGYINTKKRAHQIELQTTDEEFADEFQRCLYFTYGLIPSKKKIVVKQPGWKNKYQIRLCCKAACNDLLSYGVSFRKENWRVPQAVQNASQEVQVRYLKAFFDSEGSVDVNSRRISGTSSCLTGLMDISALLANFGIKSRISWQCKKKKVYNIRIQGRESIELFAKHIGFTIMRREKKLQQLLTNYKLWTTPREEVARLEPEMRRLKNLNFTYGEIAKQLNLSIGTIWTHLNKKNVAP